MAGIQERQVAAFSEAYAHHARLQPASAVGCFHGDLLSFQAMLDRPADAPTGDTGRFRISGQVDVHEIACTHNAMTQPAPLAHIGRVLADHLDNQHASRG